MAVLTTDSVAERAATSAWFKLVGQAAGPLAFAGIVYVAAQIPSMQSDIRIVTTTLNNMMSDRYRADEARRDFQLRDLKIDTIEARLRELEHDVRTTKLEVQPLVQSPNIQDLSKRPQRSR